VLFSVIAIQSLDSIHTNVIITSNEVIDSNFTVSGSIRDTSTVDPVHFAVTSYIAFESPNTIQSSITIGTIAPHDSMWAYSLTIQHDTNANYQNDTFSSVWLATTPSDYKKPSPWHDSWMNFVPSIGWFASIGGQNLQTDPSIVLDQEDWSGELILYSKPLRGVLSNIANGAGIAVSQSTNLISINLSSSVSEKFSFSLLDLLGRPIRSWQLPVDAGERQISLNVADVPSGVYFLRISAPGVEEMRKVVIVH